MKYTVYKHISPDGKVYIGQTSQEELYRRWQYGAGYKRNKEFYDDILSWGWKAFQHEILAETDNKNEALLLEKKYIDEAENYYNIIKNDITLKRSLAGTPKYYLPAIDKYFYTYDEIGEYFGGLSKQNIAYKIKVGNLTIKKLTKEERLAMANN